MALEYSIVTKVFSFIKYFLHIIFKWKNLNRNWKLLISYSNKVKLGISRRIPLIDKQIDLPILHDIFNYLGQKQRIVVTGDAGVGKTGILITLSEKIRSADFVFIDARMIVNYENIPEVSNALGLSGIGLVESIELKSKLQYFWKPVIVIVDQCDSIWRRQSQDLLLTLLRRLANISNLGLIVVCRTQEAIGVKELIERIDISVVELEVRELDEVLATQVLNELGIVDPKPELVRLSKNLFNLSLVGEIISKVGVSSLEQVETLQDFWEKYRITLEQEIDNNDTQYQVTECAASYAKDCLLTLDGTCQISCKHSEEEKVLLSRGVLVKDEVYQQRYRFKHEKLRDYIYSYDAVHRRGMEPNQILEELDEQFGLVAPLITDLFLKSCPAKVAELMRILKNG